VAALGLATIQAGCAQREHPSILLIVVDSLRADRLHHAGDPRRLSPFIDEFASQGTRFTSAYAAAPWTTPSVMTLLTGLEPSSHHVDNNDRALSPSVPLLAERLREAGYATGAVMPALTLAPHFGFDRGFDTFVYEPQGHSRVSGPWTVEHALSFLDGRQHRPFFLYLHFWDVHYNYNPPVPDALRYRTGTPPGPGEVNDITGHVLLGSAQQPLPQARLAWLESQYAGEVHFTDAQIGRVLAELDRLGLDERTIVVITSDHGEAFQEHGVLGHTIHLYREMTHVPLLIRWPGKVAAGRALAAPVGLVDLVPTLLDLAGFEPPAPGLDGRSMAADLTGTPAPGSIEPIEAPGGSAAPGGATGSILLATARQSDLRGLVGPDRLFIRDLTSGAEELYDLAGEKRQETNLAKERPEEASAWRRALCDRLGGPPPRGEVPIEPLPDDIVQALNEGLMTLGYVGAPASRRPGSRTLDANEERRALAISLGCGTGG
jgi:arylsulfatase A-like enzyme